MKVAIMQTGSYEAIQVENGVKDALVLLGDIGNFVSQAIRF